MHVIKTTHFIHVMETTHFIETEPYREPLRVYDARHIGGTLNLSRTLVTARLRIGAYPFRQPQYVSDRTEVDLDVLFDDCEYWQNFAVIAVERLGSLPGYGPRNGQYRGRLEPGIDAPAFNRLAAGVRERVGRINDGYLEAFSAFGGDVDAFIHFKQRVIERIAVSTEPMEVAA